MTRPQQDWTVWTALLLVQAFFGVHYVGTKVVLGHVSPPAWAAIRIVLAASLMGAWIVLARREVPRRWQDWAMLFGFACCGVIFNQILFIEGLSRTTPAHSALINTTIPVWTYLCVFLFRHERMSGRKVGGLLLALAGAVLLQADSLRDGGDLMVGDFLTLLNSISYGLFLAVSKRYLARHDSLTSIGLVFLLGAPFVFAYGARDVVALDWTALPGGVLAWMAWLILFGTIGAYALNYYALKRVHSTLVALFIYLQPLVATVLAAVLLGTRPGWAFYPAAALVFAGVGFAATGRGGGGERT